MKILTGYRGGLLDEEIARVYNSCIELRGAIIERRLSASEIRRL